MILTSDNPSASTSTAAAKTAAEPGKPYVRLARPEDYAQIDKVARRAYISDPMPMYLGAFSSVSECHQSRYRPSQQSTS